MIPVYDLQIAEYLEEVRFSCACGESQIWLHNLDFDDAIEWLKNKIPIYHMGLIGCCEKLRCYNCEEMPSECSKNDECDEYLEWDKGEALYGDKEGFVIWNV